MTKKRNAVLFVGLLLSACANQTAEEAVAEVESVSPVIQDTDCGCRFVVPVGRTIVLSDVVWSPRVLVDASRMGSHVTLKRLEIDGEPAADWQKDFRYYRPLGNGQVEYIFFALTVPGFSPGVHSIEATLEGENGKECAIRTDFTITKETWSR